MQTAELGKGTGRECVGGTMSVKIPFLSSTATLPMPSSAVIIFRVAVDKALLHSQTIPLQIANRGQKDRCRMPV